MIERIVEYPGYLIRFRSKTPTRRAVLLFHGFPAVARVRNLDWAYWIHERVAADVYLVHYHGLGEAPGIFRFTRSIAQSLELVKWLATERGHGPISLVGHSWGGLVTVNCALGARAHVDRAILLSPFCDLEKGDPLYTWFVSKVRDEAPGIFEKQTEAELERDFLTVLDKNLPMKLGPSLDPKLPLSIIQAADDDSTPAETTARFAKTLQAPPHYVTVPMDHSFTQDREKVAGLIIDRL